MAREKMNITFENLFENFQTTMNSESEQGKQPRKKKSVRSDKSETGLQYKKRHFRLL